MEGYSVAVRAFLRWCEAEDIPQELTKEKVVAFMAARTGQASTARLQLTVLKLFAKWLAGEYPEKFDATPVLLIKHPKTDERVVPDLSEDEVQRMIRACSGSALRDKRDRALLALFAETGLRAAEMLSLDVGDIDVVNCIVHVHRGKGGKGRRVSFSPGCAAALNTYRKARRAAGLTSDDGPLFVSERGGRRLSYTGLRGTLGERAADAGVVGFHVHRLRHSHAVRWIAAGGSEASLMSRSGWSSRTQIDRYVRAASEKLAAQEFERLNLGVLEA